MDILLFAVESLLLVILFIFLTFNIIRLRVKHRIPFGTQDNQEVNRAIAAQTNFLNYVPLCLVLQLSLLVFQTPIALLWIIVVLLVTGRYLHTLSMLVFERRTPPTFKARQLGMLATLLSLLITVLSLVYIAINYI